MTLPFSGEISQGFGESSEDAGILCHSGKVNGNSLFIPRSYIIISVPFCGHIDTHIIMVYEDNNNCLSIG